MDRGFQIVEGRVAAVSEGREARYLEFFADRRGLALMIPRRAERDFAAAGLRPSSLAGRLIRVRGTIGWDGLMIVDHPEQIERLNEG